MSNLIVQSTPEGIFVSRDTLDEAGIDPGRLLELSPLPDAHEIARRALGYVCWKLGDALGVGPPEWVGQEWSVPLIAPEGAPEIGRLFVSPTGEILGEKSPTHQQLLEAHDALRSKTSAG